MVNVAEEKTPNGYYLRQWHIRLMTPDLPLNVGRGLLTEPLWG